MRAPSPRSRLLAVLAAAVLLPASPAAASLTDAGGAPVEGTDWSSPLAQIVGDPGCVGTAAGAGCRVLAEPGTPDDDGAAALAALGPAGAPD
ncbi:MAG TPA: hypothetical protein VN213_04255, partial [Solirubrobacteraceae bacterium]|nr:hypothetical protein [Solirubrobacteraceae bacterium]